MSVTISSPNYPNPFNVDDQCIWLLVAPPGGVINFQFIGQFQLNCEDTCDKSYVELKTGPDFRITGYRLVANYHSCILSVAFSLIKIGIRLKQSFEDYPSFFLK